MAFHPAFGPGHLINGLPSPLKTDIEMRMFAIAKINHTTGGNVSTAFDKFGDGGHGNGRHVETPAGGMNRIGTDVPHRPASFGHVLGQPIHAGRAHDERVARTHRTDFANDARVNQLFHPPVLWMKAIHEAFHHRDIVFLCRIFNGFNIDHGECHGFFDQHMLAGLYGAQCPFFMLMIRHRQINGLDFRIVNQGIEIVISPNALLSRGVFSQGFGSGPGSATGDGDQFGIGCLNNGRDHAFIDASRAQYAETQFSGRVHGVLLLMVSLANKDSATSMSMVGGGCDGCCKITLP